MSNSNPERKYTSPLALNVTYNLDKNVTHYFQLCSKHAAAMLKRVIEYKQTNTNKSWKVVDKRTADSCAYTSNKHLVLYSGWNQIKNFVDRISCKY